MWAIQRGLTLGMPEEALYSLIDEINNYIDFPLEQSRLQIVKSAVPRYIAKAG